MPSLTYMFCVQSCMSSACIQQVSNYGAAAWSAGFPVWLRPAVALCAAACHRKTDLLTRPLDKQIHMHAHKGMIGNETWARLGPTPCS